MPLFQDGPQYLVDEKLLLSDSVQNLSQWIMKKNSYFWSITSYESFTAILGGAKLPHHLNADATVAALYSVKSG